MTRFSFWQRWLLVVSIAISVFGMSMAFFSGTPLFVLFHRQIDPAFWNANAMDDAIRQFQRWVYGAWGATVAGWGITLIYIVRYPFGRKERWSWNCLVFGLLVWFVLDTALSVFCKVYFNAALNATLFVAAGLPLLFTRKEFA